MSLYAPPRYFGFYYPIGDFLARVTNAWPSSRVRWVSSWYRDPRENARVGGAARSQHLKGLAIDVNPSASAAAFQSQGLTVIPEGDHLHIQYYRSG